MFKLILWALSLLDLLALEKKRVEKSDWSMLLRFSIAVTIWEPIAIVLQGKVGWRDAAKEQETKLVLKRN